MKIAVRIGKAAAAFALAIPAAANAQYTGVSHPDDTPIMNAPDAAPQPAPIQLQPGPLQLRPEIAIDTTSPAPVTTTTVRMPEPMLNESRYSAIPDPDAGVVTRVAGPSNQLPLGTLVKVRLTQGISTASTPSGTVFTAQLVSPIERDGRVLLPAGSTLAGLVTDVHGGKRSSGAASIHLRTTSVTLPDGTRYRIHGQVIDTSVFKEVKVDDEGTLIRRDHAAKTASTLALPVAAGAATGALVAGVPGAVVGAGVGAGVGTVVWLKQDRQAVLPLNTEVTFSLIEPLTVGHR